MSDNQNYTLQASHLTFSYSFFNKTEGSFSGTENLTSVYYKKVYDTTWTF